LENIHKIKTQQKYWLGYFKLVYWMIFGQMKTIGHSGALSSMAPIHSFFQSQINVLLPFFNWSRMLKVAADWTWPRRDVSQEGEKCARKPGTGIGMRKG
jgi:hypothetical protein